jgi:Sulfotransferase domain
MTRSLPDFVIIGATKSATTWLLQNLRAHPQVFMPSPEIHYFSRYFERGPAWYRSHFETAPEDRVVGEKSSSYLPHPETPGRLRELLPEARLVAQLRNPIERAYSDYCMHYRRGEVGRDPARYLQPGRTPLPRLLEDGLYFRHVSAFLELFPREQLKVILYDDIRRDPGPVFRSVCEHLGIERRADAELLSQRVKDKETPVVPPLARRILAPMKATVQPLRQSRAFRFARSLIARRLDYPTLTPALREQLADYYRDDVGALSKFLERDLTGWLSGGSATARPAPA